MSKGIDYGLGRTNVDTDTGIRFGVINLNHVVKAWADTAEPNYGDPVCPECGGEELTEEDDGWRCQTCSTVVDSDYAYPESPLSWVLDDEEYRAEQSGDNNDIFITKSPYYTRAAYCSPCAPGACYLTSPCEDGDRAYCFGPDWFDTDDGPLPHPIYRVSDDVRIA